MRALLCPRFVHSLRECLTVSARFTASCTTFCALVLCTHCVNALTVSARFTASCTTFLARAWCPDVVAPCLLSVSLYGSLFRMSVYVCVCVCVCACVCVRVPFSLASILSVLSHSVWCRLSSSLGWLQEFFKKTGCSYIVRAHQRKDLGVEITKGAKAIAILVLLSC